MYKAGLCCAQMRVGLRHASVLLKARTQTGKVCAGRTQLLVCSDLVSLAPKANYSNIWLM